MALTDLAWLPVEPDWSERLKASGDADWPALVLLARARLDALATGRLDRLLRRRFPEPPESGLAAPAIRLAVLGSSTLGHLVPAIRVSALRRGLHVSVHEGEYGQYRQELMQPAPELAAFRPDVVLLCLDARHLAAGLPSGATEADAEQALAATLADLARLWQAAQAMGATVIQQTALPVLPKLMGDNEQRLASSQAGFLLRLNAALRPAADAAGVHLLAVDERAARFGLSAWHDPAVWHHAKQEIGGAVAPVFGEMVGNLLAAYRGRSRKALVLDLDNTLWGGVIGDDGLEGIEIGQGNASGEAFAALQTHAKRLAARGVILAVCSKNDEANALQPFEKHPEMVLRREDIASFVANWDDKATNLRRIARALNIGLDSLVFLDDNPFERNLVRGELPEVAIPEFPEDDPALVPQMLADAGYFDTLAITADDAKRTAQYRENSERAALAETATDLPAYLRSLEMKLVWNRFDRVGLARIVQLFNKTNQFNLTTIRTTDAAIAAVIDDPRQFGLQLRLVDKFGDNGIIALVIGRLSEDGSDALIHSWVMSCRVLGRQVEAATLMLIAREARRLGATRLVGEYRPSAKNDMVREHYQRLGFVAIEPPAGAAHGGDDAAPGAFHALPLEGFEPEELFMQVSEGAY
ncbi:MAG: HAD-IIIC family phosphatase [Janthinobacterium lividum]